MRLLFCFTAICFLFAFELITNTLLTPASAQDATGCISVDESAGSVTSHCEKPAAFFYCLKGQCTGVDYYTEWDFIDPGDTLSILPGKLEYGACLGFLSSVEKTKSATYRCRSADGVLHAAQHKGTDTQDRCDLESGKCAIQAEARQPLDTKIFPLTCDGGRTIDVAVNLKLLKHRVLQMKASEGVIVQPLIKGQELTDEFLMDVALKLCTPSKDPQWTHKAKRQLSEGVFEAAEAMMDMVLWACRQTSDNPEECKRPEPVIKRSTAIGVRG